MISKEQALTIVKKIIPDIEMRGLRISDVLSGNKKLAELPKDCWYISYSQVPIQYLSCSNGSKIFLCISKENGNILFHNVII